MRSHCIHAEHGTVTLKIEWWNITKTQFTLLLQSVIMNSESCSV